MSNRAFSLVGKGELFKECQEKREKDVKHAYQNRIKNEPGSGLRGGEPLRMFMESTDSHLAVRLWWTCPPQEEPGPDDREASLSSERLVMWLQSAPTLCFQHMESH